MEPIFKKVYTLSDFETDCNGNLKLSSLLSFVQTVAGEHCIQLCADYDTLLQRNLFWAVTRHKAEILRLPRRGETVTVETWPMPTSRVAYPRACQAYDAQGNMLFRSYSIWVLMDITTRKMVLPGKSGVEVAGILRGNELDMPRSLMPLPRDNSQDRTVTYSCLDRNAHMNNTRYLDWVDDLLSAAFHGEHSPKNFTVCYLSEATEGQTVSLDWTLGEDNLLQVDGHRQGSSPTDSPVSVFSAQVQF